MFSAVFFKASVALILLLPIVIKAQIYCDTPDFVNSKCKCNGIMYDFSLIVNVNGTTFFSGTGIGLDDVYYYYFQMAHGGLPLEFPGCTFPSSMSTGNAVS